MQNFSNHTRYKIMIRTNYQKKYPHRPYIALKKDFPVIELDYEIRKRAIIFNKSLGFYQIFTMIIYGLFSWSHG